MAGDKTIRVRNVKTDEWMELSLEDLDGSGAELLYGILTPIMAKTGDETFQSPRVDVMTHAIETIDYPHHEVHAGSHFLYTDSVELDAAETQDYLIVTPNTTKWAHMLFSLDGSAITQFQLYEGSDKMGAALANFGNSNRNSATLPTTWIYKGLVSGTTDGTLIYGYKGGAAAAQSRSNAGVTHAEELILKQNTKYVLRLTSATNANLTNVMLSWYEHTSKSA